jgi:adenylate cyclase
MLITSIYHIRPFILFILAYLAMSQSYGQENGQANQIDIQILEGQVKDKYGREKLDALNKLTDYYLIYDLRKAVRYGKQATSLSDNLFGSDELARNDTSYLRSTSYNLLGMAHYKREKYINAKETFQEALAIAQDLQDSKGFGVASTYLVKIDSLASTQGALKDNVFSRTLRSLELGEKFSNASLDISIQQKIKNAENHEKNGDYEKAIENYEEAINLLRNKGDADRVNMLHTHISELRKLQGGEEEAIAYYEKAIEEQQLIADSIANASKKNINKVEKSVDRANKRPVADSVSTSEQSKTVEELAMESENYQMLAEEFEENRDYERAAEYRRIAQEYDNEIKKRQIAEAELTMLKQQKQIAELNLQTKQSELEEQARTKRSFMIGAAMLLALAFALSALYITKRNDHAKLSLAYNNLEVTKGKLVDAEKRIKSLLGQQLSGDIARELISAKAELPTQRKFVCVMFLDIREFTTFAERKEPEEIIKYQNEVFGFMIDLIHKYNGNINQFMGDGFMATFGAPVSKGNDCQNALDAACEIVEMVNSKSESGNLPSTRIGIGLHAGFVVVGNVGTEQRKQYSITGNTVIISARLEQLNKEHNTQLLISEEVYKKLDTYNYKADFHEVVVKGREKPVRILKVM